MNLLKDLIKQSARKFGVEVAYYRPPGPVTAEPAPEPAQPTLPWYGKIWGWPNVNILPLAVDALMFRHLESGKKASDFTIVQIGAFDGVVCDPIRDFIKKYGLKALLVEPQPDICEKLVASYAGSPNVLFENAAISDRDGETILHRFKKTENTPHIAGALASLHLNQLINNHHEMEGETEAIPTRLLTVDSLMKKHGLKSIDLLQIDTEGHDWSIIQSIDFNAVKPAIIHFEITLLSESDQTAAIEHLASLGYSVIWYGTADLLAFLQSKEHEPINAPKSFRNL